MRVGMEATGYSRWFERLLAELGFEVWIGDPAEIKTPISTFNAGDVYSSFPLGAVDVLPPANTCFLTLTHYQTWTGQI